MKKNILAIVILAATLVNLTLTAMILFTFVPYVNKANNLITEIAAAIQLDIGDTKEKEEQNVNIADLESFPVLENANCNLKTGEDGKTRYAQVTAFLSLNKKHEDYATLKPVLEGQIETVKSTILAAVAGYTADELNQAETREAINKAVLEKLQDIFDSTFIYSVDIRALIA